MFHHFVLLLTYLLWSMSFANNLSLFSFEVNLLLSFAQKVDINPLWVKSWAAPARNLCQSVFSFIWVNESIRINLVVMILLHLVSLCEAFRWSLNGEPLVKTERKRAKLSRNVKKNVFDGSRTGKSLCSLRSEQCCEGANLECYGCHPILYQFGLPCELQATLSSFQHRRDCFCDESCIEFEDCCHDHPDTCGHLYSDLQGN